MTANPDLPTKPKAVVSSCRDLVIRELGVPIDPSVFLLDTLEKYDIDVPKEAGPVLAEFMFRSVRGPVSALPMRCKGVECKFVDVCTLKQAKVDLPVGRPCPLEMAMIESWIAKFRSELGLDRERERYDQADQMEIIYEIVAHELLRNRAAWHLHLKPELMEERIVGATPQSMPIYDLKVNPALLISERLTRLILKLKEHLLFTPKSQAQAGKSMGDPSSEAAKLREKAKEKILARQEQIKDAEFEVGAGERTLESNT